MDPYETDEQRRERLAREAYWREIRQNVSKFFRTPAGKTTLVIAGAAGLVALVVGARKK